MNVTVCIQYKSQRLSQHPAPPIDCEGGNYSDGRQSSILPRHDTRDTGQGVFKFCPSPASGTPHHRLEAPHRPRVAHLALRRTNLLVRLFDSMHVFAA
jgi:hypothetical protein